MRIIFCRGGKCRQDCADAPTAVTEPKIPSTSPARLLETSLTDPETRGEWKSEYKSGLGIGYGYIEYRNESRDLIVTKHYSGLCSGDIVRTPFTLSKDEQKIVLDAIGRFEKHAAAAREAEALARLIGPKGKSASKKAS